MIELTNLFTGLKVEKLANKLINNIKNIFSGEYREV